jgi:hypothetical protein
MTNPILPFVECSICHLPVTLESSKTDGNGQAVHEDCYYLKLHNALSGKLPKIMGKSPTESH